MGYYLFDVGYCGQIGFINGLGVCFIGVVNDGGYNGVFFGDGKFNGGFVDSVCVFYICSGCYVLGSLLQVVCYCLVVFVIQFIFNYVGYKGGYVV